MCFCFESLPLPVIELYLCFDHKLKFEPIIYAKAEIDLSDASAPREVKERMVCAVEAGWA